MKTDQETFDTVARHLLTQGKPAVIIGQGCAYRGSDGTKCAVGCLIPDDKYSPAYENMAIGGSGMRARELQDILREQGYDNIALLQDLQRAHDDDVSSDPFDWPEFVREQLAGVAMKYGLNTKVLA